MKMHVSIPQVMVRDSNLKNKDGSSAKEQTVLLHVEGRLAPLETTLLLRGQPFPVGLYDVDAMSVQSGRYGSIDFRLRLGQPLPQQQQPQRTAA